MTSFISKMCHIEQINHNKKPLERYAFSYYIFIIFISLIAVDN